jgi:hypothetical protein
MELIHILMALIVRKGVTADQFYEFAAAKGVAGEPYVLNVWRYLLGQTSTGPMPEPMEID